MNTLSDINKKKCGGKNVNEINDSTQMENRPVRYGFPCYTGSNQ